MKRRMIFALDELLGKVEEILTPYIGVAASVGNYKFLVIAMLENFCYGSPLPAQDEMGFHLPTDVFAIIQTEIGLFIAQSIRNGLGYIWPSHHYGFTVMGNSILIEETDLKEYRRSDEADVPDTLESLAEFMSDGGYVPERMRRQLR